MTTEGEIRQLYVGGIRCAGLSGGERVEGCLREAIAGQYAICNMQYAICNMQCAMCNVQCAMCNVQCAIAIGNVQCAIGNVQ